MNEVSVLIPTCNRPTALAATLESLCFQSFDDFAIIVSDQSTIDWGPAAGTVDTVCRLLERRGRAVTRVSNLPRRGMAQQRQFLLDQSRSPYSLFLDDDVILEPFVIENLLRVIKRQDCGFAGNALIGLSYVDDVRPEEQHIEFFQDSVAPEAVTPGTPEWQRHVLHNAANILHVQEHLNIPSANPVPYKVAWVGGCVLFDTDKLRQAGGFTFWQDLPHKHCGEDVLAQLRVAKRFGGCGVLPSGAYHQELPTTITERTVNAPELLRI